MVKSGTVADAVEALLASRLDLQSARPWPGHAAPHAEDVVAVRERRELTPIDQPQVFPSGQVHANADVMALLLKLFGGLRVRLQAGSHRTAGGGRHGAVDGG